MSPTTPAARPRISESVRALSAAQKSNAGAPLYSRVINRPVGRLLAAVAHRVGLTPDQVTLLSACCTYLGIALIALWRPSAAAAVATSLLLMLGYALDSADGQLARLRHGGGQAREGGDGLHGEGQVDIVPRAPDLDAELAPGGRGGAPILLRSRFGPHEGEVRRGGCCRGRRRRRGGLRSRRRRGGGEVGPRRDRVLRFCFCAVVRHRQQRVDARAEQRCQGGQRGHVRVVEIVLPLADRLRSHAHPLGEPLLRHPL